MLQPEWYLVQYSESLTAFVWQTLYNMFSFLYHICIECESTSLCLHVRVLFTEDDLFIELEWVPDSLKPDPILPGKTRPEW